MVAKRTLLEILATDGPSPNLWIQLASGDRLPAHRDVLAWSCLVVKQLPPGDTWDISGLVVDGRPVERRTVAAWLAALYPPVEAEAAEEPGEPAQLADVLLFADAVGTSRPALRTICARCPLAAITVPAGDRRLPLPADGRAAWARGGFVWACSMKGNDQLFEGLTDEQAAAAGPQAAARVEPLLHLAYRLRLPELRDQLHAFVHANAMFNGSFLRDRELLETAVFTDRVMAAADKQRLKALWIDDVIGAPCAIGRGDAPLLVGADAGAGQKVRFKATLGRAYMGSPAGTPVDAEVDLAAGTIEFFKLGGEGSAFCSRAWLVIGGNAWGARPAADG